jgi:hypothetical protein
MHVSFRFRQLRQTQDEIIEKTSEMYDKEQYKLLQKFQRDVEAL